MAKPTAQELRDAIESYLGQSALEAAYRNRADLYEILLWKLTIEAAVAEGAVPSIRTANGSASAPYHFRKGPGPIARAGTEPFVHAQIAFPGRPILEVHQGIYVSGSSLNRHECDVAVLDGAECDGARGSNVDPRSSKLVTALEAKFYEKRIGIGLARGFAGLEKDLWLKKQRVFFVTNSTMSLVSRYLNRHDHPWEEGVALAYDGIENLRRSLRRVFKVYRTS